MDKNRLLLKLTSLVALSNLFVFLLFSFPLRAQQIPAEVLAAQGEYLDAKKEALIGRTDKAIEKFEELYRKDRNNAILAFELARLYYSQKDYIMVDKYAPSAIKADPENMTMLVFYSECLLEQTGRESEVLPLLEKITTLPKANISNFDQYIDVLLEAKNYPKSHSVVEEMATRFGETEQVLQRKFEVYDLTKSDAMAVETIDKLIRLFPLETAYLKAKASFLTSRSKLGEAKELYRKVLEIDPNDTEANLAFVDENGETKNENAYLRSLLPIIKNQSILIDRKIKELIPYVTDLANGKDTELADALKDVCETLVLTHPDEAKAHAIYGDVLMNSGDIDKAIVQYQKTLDLNDNIYAVWEQLMYAMDLKEDDVQLYKTSMDAVDLFPNQALPYLFLIKSGLNTDHIESISYLQEALMISSRNESMKNDLRALECLHLIKSGRTGEARIKMDELLKTDHISALISEVAGDLYFAEQDVKNAVQWWKKSQELGNLTQRVAKKLTDAGSF